MCPLPNIDNGGFARRWQEVREQENGLRDKNSRFSPIELDKKLAALEGIDSDFMRYAFPDWRDELPTHQELVLLAMVLAKALELDSFDVISLFDAQAFDLQVLFPLRTQKGACTDCLMQAYEDVCVQLECCPDTQSFATVADIFLNGPAN